MGARRRVGREVVLLAIIMALVILVLPRLEAASTDPVRFAVIGDYGLAGPEAAAVAALVTSWAPDFIVTTGDNNYYYGAASTIDQNIGQYYHAYISPYYGHYGPGAATNRFFPALGNHDWETPGARPYLDYFTLPGNERYYDVQRGPVHIFVLDSDWSEPDGIEVDSVQASWLRAGLAASSARWKVAVLHHPPYSSGTHGSTIAMQWPFEAWGAHAVLAGHDHLYERVTVGDFPYLVNGLGGAGRYAFRTPVEGSQVRYAADHGAMLVDADDQQITFQFFSRGGGLVDTYTLYASPSTHVPATPTDLSALTISGSEVDLAWVDNASNEQNIAIEVSTDGSTFTPLAGLGRNVTRHPLGSLDPLSTYHFRVRARNAAGDSPPSPVATATTTAAGVPGAPTALKAQAVTATRIDLTWTDGSDNERGFVVERSANGGAFAEVTSRPRNASAYSDAGLDWTVTYAYRVHAYNAFGQSTTSNTVASSTAVADLVLTALADVPAAVRPGEAFPVTSSTRNQGVIVSPSSHTRFYLVPPSGGTRIALPGTASIPNLAPGQEVSRKTTVSAPTSTPVGEYAFEGCADDRQTLVESAEGNNCRRATAPIAIGWPDLVTLTASDPPTSIRRGLKFPITDTMGNQGVANATAFKTRYYLTLDALPGPPLSGTRSVPALRAGQASKGTVTVGVPASTPLATYRVLVCADATGAVREANETNNCLASQGYVTVVP